MLPCYNPDAFINHLKMLRGDDCEDLLALRQSERHKGTRMILKESIARPRREGVGYPWRFANICKAKRDVQLPCVAR